MSAKKGSKRQSEAVELNDIDEDLPLDQLEYEDPFEDQFDEEIFFDEEGNDDDDDDDDFDEDNDVDDKNKSTTTTATTSNNDEASGNNTQSSATSRKPRKPARQPSAGGTADDDDAGGDDDDDGEHGNAADDNDVEEEGALPRVWLRSKHGMAEDEELTYDASAYDMLHALRVDWPCLSIAVLGDTLGQQRRRFPHTAYAAAGTQADASENNKILLLKMSDMHKTKHDDDSDPDEASDSDENADEDAQIAWKSIKHIGSVNKIKAMPQANHILATWSETGRVHVWDAQQHIASLDNAAIRADANLAPLHTMTAHRIEGFALDWSSVTPGRLLSGDCQSNIHLWERQGESGAWSGDAGAYQGHSASVEDLQWSPVEADVFASCSVDKTVKIWDTRSRRQSALSFVAHDTDVNVIAWNKRVTYLVVSAADDGSFRIWDLRQIGDNTPAAHFKWHTQPVTCVEWSPDEDSMVAVACAEQISIWDLSLERDADAQAALAARLAARKAGTANDDDEEDDDAILPSNLDEVDAEVPPQLLFAHQGQTDIKEAHWHWQIPGAIISTAEDGVNVFKPSNIGVA